MSGFVQSTKGSTASDTSVATTAFGVNPTAGNLIVVGVAVTGAFTTVTSVTDSTGLNTYNIAVNVGDPGIRVFYAYNVTSGASFTVTANTNTTEEIVVIAQEFSGPGASDPLDRTSSASDTSGTSTALDSTNTAALSQADEIVVGFGMVANTGTLSAGAGYSNLDTKAQTQTAGMESKVVAATTAVKATFTAGTAGTWDCVVATFKISAATTSTSSTSSSISTSTSISSTSSSTSISSTSKSTSTSSTSSSISTSTSKSTSTSSTSQSTSISTSLSSTSASTSRSTSTSSTSSSTSISTSSTSSSISTSSTSSSISTSFSTSSTSSSTSVSTSISTSISTSTSSTIIDYSTIPRAHIPAFNIYVNRRVIK